LSLFFPFVFSCEAAVVVLWKGGNPALFAGFPSVQERVANSLFEFSTLSSARHFHSA